MLNDQTLMFFSAPDGQKSNGEEPLASLRQEPRKAGKVMLFDGVCNLCNASVRWVLSRDHKQLFEFASLQSDAAHERLAEHLNEEEIATLPDSIILIDEDGVHTQSTAVLKIAKVLGFPYFFAAVFFILPRCLRDPIYRWIARNRYRWFGQQDTCMLPTPELADRFLDTGKPRSPKPK